ncbi:hypothetical protein EGK74_14050 [Neisseria weixii]|uniref:Uncharacterized protein n=1 Tax=Neisseria weixii TaxID=1853276 RepID=A0A3N4MID2_9NEIS|nr:hypothetical protein EGK74_14050 [Neisseria weixii]
MILSGDGVGFGLTGSVEGGIVRSSLLTAVAKRTDNYSTVDLIFRWILKKELTSGFSGVIIRFLLFNKQITDKCECGKPHTATKTDKM